MLKKSITYITLDGDEVTEDFYFHLTKAELVEMEMSHEGGLAVHLQAIIDSMDGSAIVAEFKQLILSSYGMRSPDGKRFVKNQALREDFEGTEAYSELFMSLCTDAEAATEFIKGIIPVGLDEEPKPKPEPKKLSVDEAREMPANELSEGLSQGRFTLS